MCRWSRFACAWLAALRARDALAYRPFGGIDAAVAEPGLFEIELSPARYQQIGPNGALFAPDMVFDYGLAERREPVLQDSLTRSLQADASGVALTGNGLFLKGVLREDSRRHGGRPRLAALAWTLRPVAEVLYERDFGGIETGPALIGAIWQIRENISFDVGLRGGCVNDQPLGEVGPA